MHRKTHHPDLEFIKKEWRGNPINALNQYINLDGPSEKDFKALLKWQTTTNPLKKLKKNQQNNVQVIPNAKPHAAVKNACTWLGHATFLITLGSTHFITDPVLYNIGPLKRLTALPCAVEDLSKIDFILLSHNHRDHCDKKSMQVLCRLNPNAVIYTGLEIGTLLKSWGIKNTIIEAGWFQNYPDAKGVQISYLPAKHWNRRGLTDLNEMLWGSFMISHHNQNLYFGADSGLGVHFEMIADLFPTINYACLGIGAYQPEWFMSTAHTSPNAAYKAFQLLKANYMIPMHYGTFDLSDEPIFYPKAELIKLKIELNNKAILLPDIGETISLIENAF